MPAAQISHNLASTLFVSFFYIIRYIDLSLRCKVDNAYSPKPSKRLNAPMACTTTENCSSGDISIRLVCYPRFHDIGGDVTRHRSLKHDLHKYPSSTLSLNFLFKFDLDTNKFSYFAMIKFSYTCSVFFIFAPAVISYLSEELINGPSGGLPLSQDQQDSLSVPVPGDLTATSFQGATNLFDNSEVNPSDLYSSDLLPNDKFNSTPDRADDGGEKTALLFDGNIGEKGGAEFSIPSVPPQILDGVPEFIIDGIRQWFSNPKKPECKVNKHPLCCEKGAPSLQNGNPFRGGRRPSVPPKVPFEPLEYSQRRRLCRSCTQPTQPPNLLLFQLPNPVPRWGKAYKVRSGGGVWDRERRCPSLPVSRKYLLLLLSRQRMHLRRLSHTLIGFFQNAPAPSQPSWIPPF